MSSRERLLNAARRASVVLADADVHHEVSQGRRSRIDPVRLAEAADVVVMIKDLDRLLGAFLREGRPGILLNSERPVGMIHMTCAHELGHYFLGHLSRADQHIDYGQTAHSSELEANEFAYSLLSPRWLVARAMAAKGWGATDLAKPEVVYQLSLRLGVSFTAMVWGLERLKLLKPGLAASIAKQQPKALKEALLPAGVPVAPKADVWELDQRDKDWLIEPRAVDQFVVRLPSHSSAGYLWSSEEVRSEGFTLTPVLVDARLQTRSDVAPLVGGRKEDLYLLENGPSRSSTRELHVQLRETQPWDGQMAAKNEVDLSFQFEQLSKGLTDGTRQRAIEQ